MKSTLILVLFPLFSIGVFGADEVESVSVFVKEGDSVTLQTGVQINGSDDVEWKLKGKLIFRISSPDSGIPVLDKTNRTFGDRMKVDKTTGDLKITNTKTTDSGEYLLKISSTKGSPETKFIVKCVFNTDRDPVKSVTEGESITLKTQIQSGEVKWRFENTLIAEINLMDHNIPVYHDVLDGRFKDRLKLNDQTGSLTIMNTRNTDSGDYKADIISSTFTIHKIFTVTVEEVKSVSVKEGESVSLHTGAKIQSADVILWRFGDRGVIIAHLNGPIVDKMWSNMNVNKQTGDLNINNIKSHHSGDYKVEINTINMISHRKYHINISGVSDTDRDPVTEGESITLKTQIQSDEVIKWRFGPQNTSIAGINLMDHRITVYYDVLDGRFKDRLKVNGQTGSLTIMNTRNTDSGVYEADIISSRFTIYKTFNVTVEVPDSGLTPGAIAGIVVPVSGLCAAVVGVIYWRWKRSKPETRNYGPNPSTTEMLSNGGDEPQYEECLKSTHETNE